MLLFLPSSLRCQCNQFNISNDYQYKKINIIFITYFASYSIFCFFWAINSNMFITVPGRVVNELITTCCASIEGYVFIKIIPYNTHFDIKVLCLKVKVNSSMWGMPQSLICISTGFGLRVVSGAHNPGLLVVYTSAKKPLSKRYSNF